MSEINTTLGVLKGSSQVPEPTADCVATEESNNKTRNKLNNLLNHQKGVRKKSPRRTAESYKRFMKIFNKSKTVSSAKIKSTLPNCYYTNRVISATSCSSNIRTFAKKAMIQIMKSPKAVMKGKFVESWKGIILASKKPPDDTGVYFCEQSPNYVVPKEIHDRVNPLFHAEGGILAALGKTNCLGLGTSLTFKINWPNPKQSPVAPCPLCAKMMCEVMKECKVEIKLCTQENKEISLNELNKKEKICESMKNEVPTYQSDSYNSLINNLNNTVNEIKNVKNVKNLI